MTNTNQTGTIKIEAKCMSKDFMPVYSATGYVLPCCYADNNNIEDFDSLMKDHLSIDTIEDIESEVLNSKEWNDFFKLLKETPELAPRSCKFYCGNNWSTANRIKLGDN